MKTNPTLDVKRQIKEWCVTNSFKFKRIYSIYETSKRILLLINKEGLIIGNPVELHLYSTSETIHQVIPIIKNVYFDKIYQNVNSHYLQTGKDATNDKYKL